MKKKSDKNGNKAKIGRKIFLNEINPKTIPIFDILRESVPKRSPITKIEFNDLYQESIQNGDTFKEFIDNIADEKNLDQEEQKQMIKKLKKGILKEKKHDEKYSKNNKVNDSGISEYKQRKIMKTPLKNVKAKIDLPEVVEKVVNDFTEGNQNLQQKDISSLVDDVIENTEKKKKKPTAKTLVKYLSQQIAEIVDEKPKEIKQKLFQQMSQQIQQEKMQATQEMTGKKIGKQDLYEIITSLMFSFLDKMGADNAEEIKNKKEEILEIVSEQIEDGRNNGYTVGQIIDNSIQEVQNIFQPEIQDMLQDEVIQEISEELGKKTGVDEDIINQKLDKGNFELLLKNFPEETNKEFFEKSSQEMVDQLLGGLITEFEKQNIQEEMDEIRNKGDNEYPTKTSDLLKREIFEQIQHQVIDALADSKEDKTLNPHNP